ncbi:MAG: YdcF family protein [Lentisphaerae bacterium]|nr:YdcF family protein [Lentisphaerota bacterium]
MYYLNKIIGFLVSPIGGAIAGGIAAVIFARLGRKGLAKWIGGLTVAWLWLWMTPIMTWVVGVPLEREFLVDGRVPMVESFPKADAILLLGGSMGIETNVNSYAEMATSADRVWQAARLFKAGRASKIIATGDYAKDTTLPLLKDFGVGEEAVSFLDARTTEEEAKGIRELFSRVEGGEVKVLLVTSAWHMKRARLMFEKYAPEIEVVCAPADFENTFTAEKTPVFKMLLPDPNVFMLNSVAFHEWVGIVGYTIFR